MTCFEHGDPNSPIAIVGEAPGRYELLRDEPFVGPSGKILDQCLHSAGLIRRGVYMLNLFEGAIQDGSKFHRNGQITGAALEPCAKLIDKLKKSKAKVIVPMGALAMAALTGKDGMLKWRGSPLPCTFKKDAVIIPTIHPAATMRGTYLWRYNIITDLKKARRAMKLGPKIIPTPNLVIDPTFRDIKDALQEISTMPDVAYDIELYNHQISCIAFCADPSWSICVPFTEGETLKEPRWSTEEEIEVWSMISKLIVANPKVRNVNQNILFDFYVMLRCNSILPQGLIADTMVAQHIMYPDFPKGLDFITSIRTDYSYYKDEGKVWNKIKVDPYEYWGYNCKDTLTALISWKDPDRGLEAEMEKTGYLDLHTRTVRKYGPLLFMMHKGVAVDGLALEGTKAEVSAKLEKAIDKLEQVADYPFNPGSPKQCYEYFYTHKGIKPYVSRTTGRPTTDDKAMQRLASKHRLREAGLVQEIRGLRKLEGTYLDIALDPDGRARTSYNPRGTKNNRISSSKTLFGTGLNFQNLHPEFRRFLIADPVA